jgi:lipid-A-disaccharide synthase
MNRYSRPCLYLIAGEVSGDLHGASLARNLQQQCSTLSLRGMGGDRMAAAGVELAQHIAGVSFMGFVEVIEHLPTIWRLFRKIEADLLAFRPNALILIDYPGFNLRMARFARKHGIPVVYYIAPQVWAWNAGRTRRMKQLIDLLVVILPFEPAFFASYGLKAHFVGHPLLDVLPPAASEHRGPETLQAVKPRVALLPGSRKQELRRMLPVMLEVARQRTDCEFVVALAPNLKPDQTLPQDLPPHISWIQGTTYDLLASVDAALVTSGTATLETGLMAVPQVVCYRGSWLSYQIARRLIRVPYISLVNLILNRPAVPELIQQNLTVQRLAAQLDSLLTDGQRRSQMLADYAELREKLQHRGASGRAAGLILEFLQGKGEDVALAGNR